MRKIIIIFITFVGLFSLSYGFEANIKVGYDFFRYLNHKIYEDFYGRENTKGTKYEYERGSAVLGIELLPFTFNDEKIKLGAGVEYNFGFHWDKNSKEPSLATLIPLYATAKFTYYRPKNIDLNLYTFARFGYAFSEKIKIEEYKNYNGLYYGLGLGLDYKYFLTELLYDGKYTIEGLSVSTVYKENGDFDRKKQNAFHFFNHKVGVRLGLQLGTQHFKKPQITKKVENELPQK